MLYDIISPFGVLVDYVLALVLFSTADEADEQSKAADSVEMADGA